MKNLLLILFVYTITHTVQAQEEVIFTDRPNTTDAVALISPGTFQIESGFLSQWDKEDGVSYNFISSPNLNVKYGLLSWLEMRLLTNYLILNTEDDVTDSSISGLSPLTLSPKFRMMRQSLWIPAVSVTTNFTFPGTGKEAFQTDKLNYGFRLLLEHVFNDKYSWSHGFGADWDDRREKTWAYSSAFAIAISEKTGAFAEIYGYFATDITSNHNFDAGLTYLVSNDLQLDTSFGLPLNENAPNFFISVGLSWKTNFKK